MLRSVQPIKKFDDIQLSEARAKLNLPIQNISNIYHAIQLAIDNSAINQQYISLTLTVEGHPNPASKDGSYELTLKKDACGKKQLSKHTRTMEFCLPRSFIDELSKLLPEGKESAIQVDSPYLLSTVTEKRFEPIGNVVTERNIQSFVSGEIIRALQERKVDEKTISVFGIDIPADTAIIARTRLTTAAGSNTGNPVVHVDAQEFRKHSQAIQKEGHKAFLQDQNNRQSTKRKMSQQAQTER